MLTPHVTAVLPAYNEAPWLEREVHGLCRDLGRALGDGGWDLVIVENGSTDDTPDVAAALAEGDGRIVAARLPAASYGSALREGIRLAHGEVVALFNVDLWDVGFLAAALSMLAECDLVIGSKLAPGGADNRPLGRRLITRALNFGLRVALGCRATDTHGMKAFWRSTIAPLAAECCTSSELFDTELVLRAERAGLRIREVPTRVTESRPARTAALQRAPRAAREFRALWMALGPVQRRSRSAPDP
jgi:glycosyltransferase involved in cell wall biosynthesis